MQKKSFGCSWLVVRMFGCVGFSRCGFFQWLRVVFGALFIRQDSDHCVHFIGFYMHKYLYSLACKQSCRFMAVLKAIDVRLFFLST